MINAGDRGGDDVDRPHHAGWKLGENGLFQARDGVNAQVVGRSRREVDARAPSLVKRVGCRVDHTGQSLNALKLAHRCRRQDRLDGGAQALIVDGSNKTAGKARRGLLEGHDLEAMTALAGRRQAALPHGETAMNNQTGSFRDGHSHPPSRVTPCSDAEPTSNRSPACRRSPVLILATACPASRPHALIVIDERA